MLRVAKSEEKPIIMAMWDSVFKEDKRYMDIYFTHKYKTENCFVLCDGGDIVSSLQVLDYTLKVGESFLKMGYISGVATLEQHRGKGHMAALLNFTFDEMVKRGYKVAALIPAEGYLFGVYEKFGFESVFRLNKYSGDKTFNSEYNYDLDELYDFYDKEQRKLPCAVMKTKEDVMAMILEHFAGGGKLLLEREGTKIRALAFEYKGEIRERLGGEFEIKKGDYVGMIKYLSAEQMPQGANPYMNMMLN